jgi:hypothetical protein
MKKLCEPDPRSSLFNITTETLRESLSKVLVSPRVPKKIQEMLEFAKKICLYAYYEYDFYSLCTIYLFLLTETAIKERFLHELPQKCKLIKKGKSESVTKSYNAIYERLQKGWKIDGFREISHSLDSILKWLKEHQILPQRISEYQIDLLRQLRNDAAHLKSKDIYPPAMVIPMIWLLTDFVNCLYDPEVHGKEPNAIKQTREYYKSISEETKKIFKKERNGCKRG